MSTENITPETTGQNEPKKRSLIDFIKELYAPSSYIFIGVNIVCLIVLLFCLTAEMGGLGSKIFGFLFCLIVGGFIAARWSIKRNGDVLEWFRGGAGVLLVFFTGLMYMNDGYVSPYAGSGGSSGSYPKECKAGCGYDITSSTYDCDGYHCMCKPGEDGESTRDKARRF